MMQSRFQLTSATATKRCWAPAAAASRAGGLLPASRRLPIAASSTAAASSVADATTSVPPNVGNSVVPLAGSSSAAVRLAGRRTPDAGSEAAGSSKLFAWTKTWYPVMMEEALDPKVPRHVDLLGKSLVIWADSQGKWHCVEDVCPHRLAPLSEGRVEGDTLMCSYHGWTFDCKGSCTNIPQIAPGPERTKACSARKASVRAYPTATAHGLLWVWPEAGAKAADEAEAVTPGKGLVTEGRTSFFRREVPTRLVTQLENLTDAGHVPFAHHGVAGSSRYNEAAHQLWGRLVATEPTIEGFEASVESRFGPISLRFQAPGLVQFNAAGLSGPHIFVVPTKPGWSCVYVNQPSDMPKLPALQRAVWRFLYGPNAVVFQHMQAHLAVDGDVYLLHTSDRLMPMSDGAGLPAIRQYYVPSAADSTMLALRKWFSEFGGQVPTMGPRDVARESPAMSKRQVMDRWEHHSKDCPHCRAAAQRLDLARGLTLAVGVMGLAATAAAGVLMALDLPALTATLADRGSGNAAAAAAGAGAGALPGAWAWLVAAQGLGLPQVALGGVAAAALAVGAHRTLGGLRDIFYYVDYVHAHRD